MTLKITEALIRDLPKTDLHVHLDGSIRLNTLCELAKEYNVEMPSYTEDGMRELVFKDTYANLPEYLEGFSYTCAVLQTEEALERCAYEFGVDNYLEGVRYFEVRFAPQLHINSRLNAEMVLRAVNRGLKRAKEEFNAKPEVVSGAEPHYGYGIIVCAMRFFNESSSEYFHHLINVHKHAPMKEIFSLASLEIARTAVSIRDAEGLPIVGFDLAGAEAGFPPDDHIAAYSYVHEHFMKKTVHAGEAYGPESVFQAITALHADRIGHGTYLLDPTAIRDPRITDREAYVDQLGQYIADRRITLEICLTSNLQTNPHMHTLADHTYENIRRHKLSTTICTDNRLVSNTTVTRELEMVTRELKFTPKDLRSVVIYGFKRSFMPGTYLEKRAYVREIIDYYEKVEKAHLALQEQA